MPIVVMGSVFVDIKGYPLSQYIPGGRNMGRVEQVHGGVGRNIAEDIANVDLHPIFLSLVDDNGTGIDVIKKLSESHVDVSYIRKVKDGMGTWLAVFNNDNDVTAAISKRPDLMPLLDVLNEKGDEIFEKAESFLFELDIEKEISDKIYELAKKHQVPVYAAVSNMSIAAARREILKKTDCFVCNLQEAGILFSEEYEDKTPEEMEQILSENVKNACIPSMVVTMGKEGAVYASISGDSGHVPSTRANVLDTTGAGDAFFAGVSMGLTYKKTLREACEIGTRLAVSVIETRENVCPKFLPSEFSITP